MSPEQAILSLEQLGEIFARSKEDPAARAIASIIFAILASLHDNSLMELRDTTMGYVKSRIAVNKGIQSKAETFKPETYIPDMPCMN